MHSQQDRQRARNSIADTLRGCKETILVSLKAYDDSASIRVLLYSSYFVNLPAETIEQMNGSRLAKDESLKIKQINQTILDLKVGSVLSMSNAASILLSNCVQGGHTPITSKSLHVVMNLDNKYSKLQVYNRSSE